jgi:hypothetical protein
MLGSNSSTEKLHVFTVVDSKDDGYLPARKRKIRPFCESITVPKWDSSWQVLTASRRVLDCRCRSGHCDCWSCHWSSDCQKGYWCWLQRNSGRECLDRDLEPCPSLTFYSKLFDHESRFLIYELVEYIHCNSMFNFKRNPFRRQEYLDGHNVMAGYDGFQLYIYG